MQWQATAVCLLVQAVELLLLTTGGRMHTPTSHSTADWHQLEQNRSTIGNCAKHPQTPTLLA